jgi:uncharacterized NAD(P)/FAD-binding protein YdhS
MSSANPVLAVVGGGSVATSFIRQLAQQAQQEGASGIAEVLVFEPRAQPGAGDAYQDDTPSNLLNTRAAGMSALHGDPDHFLRWAMRHESEWRDTFPDAVLGGDSFLPRALFGRYMRHAYDEAVGILQQLGVSVRHVRAGVTSMRCVEERYELATLTEGTYRADQVVLALGNQEGTAFDHLRPYENYFSSPYPCTGLGARIERRKAVCIIGSGLSAIDAAVSLADAGHRGKIVMVSRHGRLPSVRGDHNRSHKPRLSRERVDALARQRGGRLRLREVGEMLLRELEQGEGAPADLTEILQPGHGPHRDVDADIGVASARDRTWQSIVDRLDDAIDLVWHYLPDADRRIFERDFKSQWLSYRVSFQPCNARKIQQLLHTEQLSVYRGCADVSFVPAHEHFAVSVLDHGKAFSATLYADHVINATGCTTDVRQCRSPLLRGMLASGLARAHEFGGIEVDFASSQVMTRQGRMLPGLYALGSMVSGTYFWTHAMNVNCRLAAGVARGVMTRTARAQPAQAPVPMRESEATATWRLQTA